MDVPWAETVLGEVSVARFREVRCQTPFRAPSQQKPLTPTDLRVFADRRVPPISMTQRGMSPKIATAPTSRKPRLSICVAPRTGETGLKVRCFTESVRPHQGGRPFRERSASHSTRLLLTSERPFGGNTHLPTRLPLGPGDVCTPPSPKSGSFIRGPLDPRDPTT